MNKNIIAILVAFMATVTIFILDVSGGLLLTSCSNQPGSSSSSSSSSAPAGPATLTIVNNSGYNLANVRWTDGNGTTYNFGTNQWTYNGNTYTGLANSYSWTTNVISGSNPVLLAIPLGVNYMGYHTDPITVAPNSSYTDIITSSTIVYFGD